MLYCVLCGTENTDGSSFCAVCGTKLQSDDPIPSVSHSQSERQPADNAPFQEPGPADRATLTAASPAPSGSTTGVNLSVDLDSIAQTIEESRDDYNELVKQLQELKLKQARGEISQEVYEVARQQLVMSDVMGEQAAREADMVEFTLLRQRRDRREISEAVYLIKLEELKQKTASQKPAKEASQEQVVRNAQLADLNAKLKRGDISEEEFDTQRSQVVTATPTANPPSHASNPADSGSFGYAVLGFFFPLVGLILYLVWKDSKPLSAGKAGKGALAGVITTVMLYLIYFLFIAAMFSSVTRFR